MKRPYSKIRALAAPLLVCLPLSLHAADFTLNLSNTTLPSPYQTNWDSAPWRPTSGAIPGVNDTITELKATGQTKYLGLNGDRTVAGFIRASAGSVTSVRITNGDATNPSANGGLQTLTVTGELAIHANTYLYSTLPTSGHMMAVEADSLLIGEAILYFGLSSGRYLQSVNINSSTTIAAGAFLTNVSRGFADDAINLGHVINDGTFALASGAALEGSSHSVTFNVQSLSGGSSGVITADSATGGSAILRIAGTNQTIATYAGILQNENSAELKVIKEGSGEQRFTHESGNNFTGGTEISSGALIVSNQTGSALGRGSVTVRNQAALVAEGSMRLAPGAGESISFENGSLFVAGRTGGLSNTTLSGAENGAAPLLQMASGAAFAFRLEAGASDTIAFTDYATGDLQLNGNEVQFTGFSGPGRWTIFTFDSDISEESWWNNGGLILSDGAFAGLSGHSAHFVYNTHSIELVVIPEPGTFGLVLAGSFLALIFAQKKIDL